MIEQRIELDRARLRAHKLRLQIKAAERKVHTTRDFKQAERAERKLPTLLELLVEAENEIHRLELPVEVKKAEVTAPLTYSDADLMFDDDLTIPKFLRRTP